MAEEKKKDRVILHCDCNSFFASVETALNPAYRDKPMAVCGSEEERHGIVLAKNELAKQFGIETAETVWSAKRKCPSLVVAPPHYSAYADFSRRINQIYDQYTDLVEPFSIDESWLDITGSAALFGDGVSVANELRRRVREEIGITISVGVSYNKTFAKMGSDYKKPDATTVIDRQNFKAMLYRLPVGNLFFVGRRTQEALENANIHTIGELAAASPTFLENKLGKMGLLIHRYALGEDDSPVLSRTQAENSLPKSVSNGRTFRRDIEKMEEIKVAVQSLSEPLGKKLREIGMKAATVSVNIKDTLLQTVGKQTTLQTPTDLSREIADSAVALIPTFWAVGRPIRAITVSVSHFFPVAGEVAQLSFFESEKEKKREKIGRIEGALDDIRGRFGTDAIGSGALICNDFGLGNDKKEK